MDSPPHVLSSVAVIVIEDADAGYESLLRELGATGLRVTAVRVRNAAELDAALAHRHYDAVIVAQRTAEFHSLDALKQVRECDPDLPFLVVSGAHGEDLAMEAMRAGADDYLVRDDGGLLAALERALRVAANRRGRRRAESALRESESRFAALTQNLPGMVFQLELGEAGPVFRYVSDGSYRVLRMAPGELLAKPALLFDALAPADAANLRATLAEAATTTRFVEWAAPLAGPAGDDPRWIEVFARSRRQTSGAILWDGIVSDATAARQAQQGLRELASHLTRAREEEREAVARELHDDVGSTLSAVKFALAWLKREAGQLAPLAAKLKEVEQLVDSVIVSSTRIIHDLRPGILDEGLVPSLEWQARTFEHRMGIPCSFQASRDEIQLDGTAAVAMFRVCQEALNNIAKHAHATRVDVRLDATEDALMLEIHDNGCGIAVADIAKRSCFGLRGMKERARALGGEVDVRSDRDGGTTVAFSLFTHPVTGASPAAGNGR